MVYFQDGRDTHAVTSVNNQGVRAWNQQMMIGTQHQTPRLQPEQMSRCPDSRQVLFSTCFMLVAPSTKHPDSSQSRCPDVQTADKSYSPHASCWWHPATNTQTPARGDVQMSRQQTSVILHMLHVGGTQHQTPRLQPEEMSRCPDSRQVLFSWRKLETIGSLSLMREETVSPEPCPTWFHTVKQLNRNAFEKRPPSTMKHPHVHVLP